MNNRRLVIHLTVIVLMSLFLVPCSSFAQFWSEMDSGTEEYIWGIWGTSSSNVYAVAGHRPGDCAILHYDGTSWSDVECITSNRLEGIWGSSENNVIAVGTGGTIIHYDGSSWTQMESRTTIDLTDVWVNADNDAFVVGLEGTILHYDGSTWTEMESGTELPLYGLWGFSGTNVYAVGSDGTTLHYDGSSWSEMDGGTTRTLQDIWGNSENDIFAVGWYGTIVHYDGISWSAMNSDIDVRIFGVWGSSGNDVFVVGDPSGHVPGGGSTILHYDGSSWSGMVSPRSQFLYDIWGSAPDDVFAVGKLGFILHYPSSKFIPHVAEVIPMDTLTEQGVIDLAYDATYLWGIDGSLYLQTQYIVKVNPSTGEIVESFPIINVDGRDLAYGVAYGRNYLWVTRNDRIEAIDPDTGELDQGKSINLGIDKMGRSPSGGTWDGSYLWFGSGGLDSSGSSLMLRKVDIDSKSIVMEQSIPITAVDDLVFAQGFLWIVGKGLHPAPDAYLYKIDPDTFDIVDQYNTSFTSNGITFDGNYLIIADGFGLEYRWFDSGLEKETDCLVREIYGEGSEKTKFLRRFRDNVLDSTPEGKKLIKLYYQWNPTIVKAMRADEDFQNELREIVETILPMLKKAVK